ncbi:hypothetical protein HMF8227_00264 [Saliniradius amylolyticus]|uniref:Solute-binding protein family 3/N-terminal domain-containing protein n=1 Tax=Saliniradius amylolyticus TaxID=2183582 RepID=A0A2S2DZR0_9ALTE|nr:hypothetical protein [Saliniradius amylolyticus]AWL10772.1 hypothetical protein HMF8227_00264 [Saliniradius amylolyticus]
MYRLITLLMVLLSFESYPGEERATYSKPERLVISHLDHPGIQPFVSMIKAVYQDDLGIKVTLLPTPAMRGFFMVNEGFSDADVLRIDVNAGAFENLIIVEPGLLIGELLLLCQRGLECTTEVFSDPESIILTNMANQRILDGYQFKARVVNNEKLSDTLEMLTEGRVRYGIFGSYGTFTDKLRESFEVTELKKVRLHHVIHKKHSGLLPELQQSLNKRLNGKSFLQD